MDAEYLLLEARSAPGPRTAWRRSGTRESPGEATLTVDSGAELVIGHDSARVKVGVGKPREVRNTSDGPSWDFSRIPVHPPERHEVAVESATADQAMSGRSIVRQEEETHADRRHLLDSEAHQPMRAHFGQDFSEIPLFSADQPDQATRQPLPPQQLLPSMGEEAVTPGQCLHDGTRADLERHFGWNLENLRIHTDITAQQAAMTQDAKAVCSGTDISFGPGQYTPATHAGRRLLVHEVAHVVQQAHGLAGLPTSSPAALEEAAQEAANHTAPSRSSLHMGAARFGDLQAESAGPSDLHFFGEPGETGVGVLFIRGWNGLSPQEKDQVLFWLSEADQHYGSGIAGPRQQVSKEARSAADKVAALGRRGLELGKESASGHTPDVAGGGIPTSPQIGLPKQVNWSIGGQWARYKPGFSFTGISAYDESTGKWIYLSGALEHEPPPTTPGPPRRPPVPRVPSDTSPATGKATPSPKAMPSPAEAPGHDAEVTPPLSKVTPPTAVPADEPAIPAAPRSGVLAGGEEPLGVGDTIKSPSRPTTMPPGESSAEEDLRSLGVAATAEALFAVIDLVVSIWLQRQYREEIDKAAKAKIRERLAADEQRFAAVVKAHQSDIASWRAQGKAAYLFIELELDWQNTDIGQVLMKVDVSRIAMSAAGDVGLSPRQPTLSDFLRTLVHEMWNSTLSYEIVPIKIDGQDGVVSQVPEKQPSANRPKTLPPSHSGAAPPPRSLELLPPSSAAQQPFAPLPGTPGPSPYAEAKERATEARSMTEALLSKGEALERRLGSGNEPTKEERDSFAHEEEQWRQAVSAALNYYKEHSLDEARAVLDELLNSEKYGGRLAQIRVHLGL